MSEVLFEGLLGDDWAQVHPVIQRHFDFRANSDDQKLLIGLMTNVDHSGGPAWLFIPFAFLLGGPVPYRGKNVPVKVAYRVRGRVLHWRREFEFGPRKWIFPSHLVIDGPGLATEYVRFGIGTEFAIKARQGALEFRSLGYHWRIGRWRIPMPISWLLGELWVEEVGLSDTDFEMRMTIRHPWFGELFAYAGRFELPR